MRDDLMNNAGDKTLNCADIEVYLDAYLDGELEGPLRSSFEHHIAQCESCKTLVLDCSHILRIAKTLADQPIPPGVSTRLRERLRMEGCFISGGAALHLVDLDSD